MAISAESVSSAFPERRVNGTSSHRGLFRPSVREAYVSVAARVDPGFVDVGGNLTGADRAGGIAGADCLAAHSLRATAWPLLAAPRRAPTGRSRRRALAGCSIRTNAIASMRWFCTMSLRAPAPSK